MARFILGHRLRVLGDRHPAVARVLYRIDHAFFSAALWLIRLMPLDAASRFGARIGAALGPRFKKSRALDENLRIAFPGMETAARADIARRAWANAGAVFAEYAHLEQIADPAAGRLEIRGAGLLGIGESGCRAIFVTMHHANWELAAAAIHSLGLPLSCVYSPPTNPLLDELLARWRGTLGCELLPREESMRPMLRALGAGRSLGLVMDRRVDSGKPVALFGHPKPTTLIPARLALRTGVDLVPLRVERLGGVHFRASFHPPVAVPPGDDEIARAVQMTEAVHALFEQWVRERPGDWFPSKRLWPKDVYATAPAALDTVSGPAGSAAPRRVPT
jgi:KDO2-lipid IV(A) lauroyltransferase